MNVDWDFQCQLKVNAAILPVLHHASSTPSHFARKKHTPCSLSCSSLPHNRQVLQCNAMPALYITQAASRRGLEGSQADQVKSKPLSSAGRLCVGRQAAIQLMRLPAALTQPAG